MLHQLYCAGDGKSEAVLVEFFCILLENIFLLFGEAVNIINQYYVPSGFSAATDLICASIRAWCDYICY